MLEVLFSLLPGGGLLAVLGGAALAVTAAYAKGRLSGRRSERDRQAREEWKARDMADEIDDAVAGRSPGENRERLSRWSR
jgi:hypothetical protein